jgi:ribosomal protein L11 methyltransferase
VIRLAVRVRREQSEIVLAELLELAPGGVEEVSIGSGEIVEYAVYGAPGELPALPDLTAAAGSALVEVRTSEVADDWAERWREFHRPLVLDGLSVRPPWEPPVGSGVQLVIDPGQAFGTGAHATTRLCLELMLSHFGAGGGEFLDLGCGSGVLAIAAALLGFSPVVALDFDPVAVSVAGENAAVNGASIDVRRHDLRVDPVAVAPTVAANLLRPLLLTWAGRLEGAPELPERIIASGLLVGEADEIAGAFARVGLVESARRESGDWAALLLVARHP